MLRTIDRINGYAVQKITKPDGSLIRYQVIKEASIGQEKAECFPRLGDARMFAVVVAQNEAVTQ
jgi:hypothetical protein